MYLWYKNARVFSGLKYLAQDNPYHAMTSVCRLSSGAWCERASIAKSAWAMRCPRVSCARLAFYWKPYKICLSRSLLDNVIFFLFFFYCYFDRNSSSLGWAIFNRVPFWFHHLQCLLHSGTPAAGRILWRFRRWVLRNKVIVYAEFMTALLVYNLASTNIQYNTKIQYKTWRL